MVYQESKKEKRKARDDQRRKDSFIAAYVRVKYPHIHAESTLYHNKLRDFFPNKADLTKTEHFKRWKADTRPQQPLKIAPKQQPCKTPQQATSTKKSESIKLNMELNIPLMNISTRESDIDPITEEIHPSLLEEISSENMEYIINQLLQDPDLQNIFTGFDSMPEVGVEVEVDIGEDTRLEDELM